MLSNVKITPVERSFEDLFGHVIGFPRRRETSFDKGVERDLDTVREPLEIADQHQIFEFRRHFFEKS